jgi:hypothetical protein
MCLRERCIASRINLVRAVNTSVMDKLQQCLTSLCVHPLRIGKGASVRPDIDFDVITRCLIVSSDSACLVEFLLFGDTCSLLRISNEHSNASEKLPWSVWRKMREAELEFPRHFGKLAVVWHDVLYRTGCMGRCTQCHTCNELPGTTQDDR